MSLPESHHGVTWLHKLGEKQMEFIWEHRRGGMNLVLVYKLNARQPLSHDTMYQSLQHLQRKVPAYQFAIRERDGELWVCKPQNVDIDFKVYQRGTPTQVAIEELQDPFNAAIGPLWKVRLIPADEDEQCSLPELKKDYPYQYDLCLSPHHSIHDGGSNISVVQPFLNIINDVMEGNHIDDNLPIGVYVSNEEFEKTKKLFKDKLLKDPARLEALRKKMIHSAKSPFILKCFPLPANVVKPEIKTISVETDHTAFVSLLNQCRKVGVTVGTAFQMITNIALVELAQDAGSSNDEFYDLDVYLIVNLRRYMKKRELPVHGVHIAEIISTITIGKQTREDFWKNCLALDQLNKEQLKSGSVFERNIGREMFLPKMDSRDLSVNSPVTVTFDYKYSNTGSLEVRIPGTGKYVQLTATKSYNRFDMLKTPFFQHVFTYRGTISNTISYSTTWLTDQNAANLAYKIKSVIESIAQNNDVVSSHL